MIDPRAIIDPSAVIGEGVEIGPWTIVGAAVVVGDGCRIASHVVIDGPTRIGPSNHIFQFASIGGSRPALLDEAGPVPTVPTVPTGELIIGDGNTFREGVTVHRGTEQESGRTTLGNRNLLMPGAHVGHDCVLGNHISMANHSAAYANVTIGDHADVGGYAGISENTSIGACTHIGTMSRVEHDVPSYVAVRGNPASVAGVNVEGMGRRGISANAIAALCDAYRTVYEAGLSVEEALEALRVSAQRCREVELFLESVEASVEASEEEGSVGLIRLRGGDAADA